MFSNVLWLPKRGNTPEQFDDAYALNHEDRRYAIADGVTDSYDPGRWARLLVQDFVDCDWPSREYLPLILAPLSREWHRQINWIDLPWYKVEKAHMGASCTFLGLWIDALPKSTSTYGTWAAAALGDSCLLQLRQGELLPESLFPLRHREDFGVTPAQLGTNASRFKRELKHLVVHEGRYQPGDVFLLATDAVAQYLIGEWEDGGQPWELFRGNSQEQFEENIEMLRDQRKIRNDDVTMMIIQMGGNEIDGPETPSKGW